VGWFHTALGHGVRHQEEIESAVDDLRLLHEALVHVSALGWVVNEVLTVLVRLLEEPLAHALVHDDQRDLGRVVLTFVLAVKEAVLLLDNLVELLQFEIDDLLSHAVAHTVTVDENVVRHSAIVELAVALE
jgi:hypothetical protein